MNKPNVIVITGPTGTGKTTVSILLAKRLDGEVVSSDSMQVYKYMDIGTAKPSAAEMNGVRHHMIDTVPPWEDYSVARYTEDASQCIDDIIKRNKIPIITGGTGFYTDSLLKGREFSARGDDKLRKHFESEYDNIGGEVMLERLRLFDIDSALRLHSNDKKRIVRAFEIYEITGKTITLHDKESAALPQRYNAIKFALIYSDRAELYNKIERRVDEMISKGLENEVRSLYKKGVSRTNTSMQAIGYKEFSDFINNDLDIRSVTDKIKTESRRYAKRQLTWLRRDEDINRIIINGTTDPIETVNKITELLYETK